MPFPFLSQSSKFIDIDTIMVIFVVCLTLYRLGFPVLFYLQARWPSRSFANSQQPPWMTTWTSLKNPLQFTENGTATKPGYIRESLLIKSCRGWERGKCRCKSSLGGKRVLYCHFYDLMCLRRPPLTSVREFHRLRVFPASFSCQYAIVLSFCGRSFDSDH